MIKSIGPYQVTREIGRGGMGVVHLARDERLDRDVAIKALPEELASDAARLERFEREAKTLAQLNHANVAGIYGVEEQDGQKYLILEYVEGETLGDRLDRGPIPVDEAIELALEIARGVEAAHEAGVIHRDLKPDNIKITPDGKVKVLDFGLARRVASTSAIEAMDSPTVVGASPTIPGAILGTAAYMSPEQARGRHVDKRTDIWSFGVILYEMLAGASPFAGETATDSIGAVLHKDIDVGRLPSGTPEGVRRALARCLERDREFRYRDIGDVRIELARRDAGAVGAAGTSRWAPWAVAVAGGAIGIAGVAMWALRAPTIQEATPTVAHLSVTVDDEEAIDSLRRPKLSNDGRRLLLQGSVDQERYAFVRDLGDPSIRIIPNSRGVGDYAISPDGRWVCLAQDGVFRKLPVDGGPSVDICETPSGRGCVWTDDGLIVFSPGRRAPLHRVDANGGEAVPLYSLEEGSTYADFGPEALPGGRGILFGRATTPGAEWNEIALMFVPTEGGEPRVLIRNAAHGRYLETGHIVFQRQDTLMAVGFDLDRLEVTTGESPVFRGIGHRPGTGDAPEAFDISRNGTLLYMPDAESSADRRIGVVSLDGTWTPLSDRTGRYWEVSPADDDRFLAVRMADELGKPRLSILEVGRDLIRPVPDASDSWHGSAAWHPDGKWIAFARRTSDQLGYEICRYRVSSAAEPEVLYSFEDFLQVYDWSSDGRTLLASRWSDDTSLDLVLFHFDEQGNLQASGPELLVGWPGSESMALLSPDDSWVLFRSSGTAGVQMYAVSLDDPSQSVQVSVDSGNFGAWAPDQDRIYYVDDDEFPMAFFSVDFSVSEDGEFLPSVPVPMFELDGVSDLDSLQMTADGSAFYIPKPLEGAGDERADPPQIVINWGESIKELLPRAERGRRR